MADEFDFDKGVKDDYVGTVIDAYFKGSENNPTDINLVLKKEAEDGEVVEDFYRVGTDWASFDGGETVEHPSKTRMRADSQVATLTMRAIDCGAPLQARSDALNNLGPRAAKLWIGLTFHWAVDQKHVDFTNAKGERVERDVYKSYPDKYIGETDSSTTSSTPGDNDGSIEIPPEVFAKLKILAESKSFPEWVDEALTIDWMRENMLSALGDETLYNSLKG